MPRGARIALGGIIQETNTFSPVPTELSDFLAHSPPLRRGPAMVADLAGVNVATGGAIETLLANGCELRPTVWAGASPSGRVTQIAFESIATEILEGIRAALPIDGVFLDLHGAMVSEHLEDPDGELCARVRSVVGPDVPIAVTLDLHANVSEKMIREASLMDACRTYPHVDLGVTGARAARILLELIACPRPWYKSLRKLEYLIPVPWQCSEIEPARSIYAAISANTWSASSLSFTPGFHFADVPCAGPAIFGYGRMSHALAEDMRRLHQMLADAETVFGGDIFDAAEAVQYALEHHTPSGGPVVIADTEDNPGAGCTGDETGLLTELVHRQARDAVVATIYDPRTAEMARVAGEGERLQLSLGGSRDDMPFRGTGIVERVSSGTFAATGPILRGVEMNLGTTALLRVNDVRVIVASRAIQAFDQAILRLVGIEPRAQRILCLKSSVHFRASFEPIASEVIVAAAGGLCPIDPRKMEFTRLNPELRLFPKRSARA